ncbi:MAG TPA: UDP-N-acetylmuramoyl-L-alanine--D-glutamate ligase [Candidatus Limnocylindrales bacterium]|nr:UDP-N-acetylmuramoyl-L-alanine--D-glutamate ligase [Candidatus Limnocylindrales bacterium]
MTDPLYEQTILVIGFARQGRALARWLPTIGARVVVSDSKTAEQLGVNADNYPGVTLALGDQSVALLKGVDKVCLSGGVPLDMPLARAALEKGIPLTNDAQLFLERCPAPVIGITGSAGKTTTTTLTGEIIKRAGYRTWVGGNIGDVLLDVLPLIRATDRVVMELSSFQLELMTVSPDVAAVLNITPNHLDRHGTMEAYTRAKAHIIEHQHERTNVAVLGRDDAGSRALADEVYGKVAWFSANEMVEHGAFLAGQRLVLAGHCSPDRKPHVIGERGEILLRGDHNVLNVLAACALTGAVSVRPDLMMAAVREFHGVPHRLEIVRELNGITWVNDSIATAPERVLAALHSFGEPLVLLLGGRDKKLPWDEMIAVALRQCRRIIAFGEAGDLVAEAVGRVGGSGAGVERVDTLAEAVARAQNTAQPGDVVLLSPGGTSYDAYPDFAARGEEFRELVQGL